MKITLRVLFLCTAICLLLGACLPALAAEGDGLTFTADDLYAPDKRMDQAPNTFEAWINLPVSTKSDRSHILSNRSSGSRMVTFDVLSKGRPAIVITEGEDESANFIFDQVNVCTGEWLHLAIVRDPENLTVSCYVNGQLKQTLAIDGAIWDSDLIPGAPMVLGGMWQTDNTTYFRGSIRSVAVFSTARTAEQIAADMESPLGAEGLMLYYDLSNTNPGDDIADLSGNGYDILYRQNLAWISAADKTSVNDYAYSFAVLGDTQALNFFYPDKFGTLYSWIVKNADSKKIDYVFGLGDITDANSLPEWDRAKAAFHSLDGVVDYSLVRGNHDKIPQYNEYFPWSDYSSTHDGSYDNTMLNTYRLFESGRVKYLLINLDFGPSDAVLDWAGDLCEQYPDRNVIINTHAYLYVNARPITATDHVPPVGNGGSNNGDQMWDKLISKHKNITLVLCGHEAGNRIAIAQDKGDHGNTVTQLLINTSTLEESTTTGLAMVAMLYFSEDGKNVQVEYYSIIRDEYFRSINQFEFQVDVVENSLLDHVPADPTPSEPEPTQSDAPSAAPPSAPAMNTTVLVIIIAMGTAVLVCVVLLVALLTKRKKDEE